jgi:serine/threonine protein kinase
VSSLETSAALSTGQRLDDFEILRLLGSGAFARVYLAYQMSLDRLVALKVSADRGRSREARSLAGLDHDHIVKVFSETIDPEHGRRLLCMQYVPGSSLQRILEALAHRDRGTWSGRTLLDTLDELCTESTPFDPAALAGRTFLQSCDWMEAVCRLGAQLAEALAHAHAQGVLHCDVKPANILLNRYGRPLLADFNIALETHQSNAGERSGIGGTVGYVAPEHLDALNAEAQTPPEVVDQRSDIYSLGVVLFQMLTGRLPFQDVPHPTDRGAMLRALAAVARAGAPSPRQVNPDVPEVLDRVIRRCLQPVPECRYQTATQLAQALKGCGELRRIDKEMPAAGPLTRTAGRHPFLLLLILTLLPHVLGSVVNITYNALRIVDELTPAQQTCFVRLVLAYNAVVYPTCIGLLILLVAPVFSVWRRLPSGGLTDATVDAGRRRALQLPLWAVGLSCAGWLPGGFLIPLGLHVWAGPIPVEVFGHFLVSFTISGLIALTYSYFAVQCLAMRVLYPRLWTDARELPQRAPLELAPVARRLRVFQMLAGLIPLTGAALLIGAVDPEHFTLTFRLLVTALIAVGMAGFGLAVLFSSRLSQALTALTR